MLEDYFNEERTIIITTHQVEEIENLLTDLMFINDGRIVLDASMDTLPEQYVELLANNDAADQASSSTYCSLLTERRSSC